MKKCKCKSKHCKHYESDFDKLAKEHLPEAAAPIISPYMNVAEAIAGKKARKLGLNVGGDLGNDPSLDLDFIKDLDNLLAEYGYDYAFMVYGENKESDVMWHAFSKNFNESIYLYLTKIIIPSMKERLGINDKNEPPTTQ